MPKHVNLNLDYIPGFKEDRWIPEYTHTTWSAGAQNISREQGTSFRDEGDQFGYPEDQLVGVGFLAKFTVHPTLDGQLVGIADFVVGDQIWT